MIPMKGLIPLIARLFNVYFLENIYAPTQPKIKLFKKIMSFFQGPDQLCTMMGLISMLSRTRCIMVHFMYQIAWASVGTQIKQSFLVSL